MGDGRIQERKVVVVGAGAVGSTFAYALAMSGLAEEIVLLDPNESLARGQVLDLVHGQPYFPTVHIHPGGPADYADAALIVITAGAKQQPGQTRLALLQTNARIMESIMDAIVAAHSRAVVVVVSNPVDVLTFVAARRTGWPRGRVMGSGTVLDSARLRYMLGAYCHVDTHNAHGYILGEHGDSEFAAWSMTHIGGLPIDDYCASCQACGDWRARRAEIEKEVRESAYHIIGYKGATCYAVGLALTRIAGAILRGERSILTVSTLLQGEYGLKDVCLSVPCLVSDRGVERVIQGRLRPEEQQALERSASILQSALGDLDKGGITPA